ncbi:MAG TPA: DPP IV N-terminal domain-containing protein [Gemmatimonadaceae bacterium]|nr:DPP IV N-terminal domain-containing protein [Gemmatimonadaceae bacterium]
MATELRSQTRAQGTGITCRATHVDGPLATTGSARWSPDGEFISFDSNADGNLHGYVVPSGGGRVRALTTGSSQNYVAAWSHDGRLIYFTSNRSGEKQVWRMPAAGGQPEQVTKHGG